MEKPETAHKVSWWLATKVTWSFAWRYLVWVLLMCIIAGAVNGILVAVVRIIFDFPTDHPLKGVYILFSSVVIVFALIVNMVRMMLNKREFNDFTFIPKE